MQVLQEKYLQDLDIFRKTVFTGRVARSSRNVARCTGFLLQIGVPYGIGYACRAVTSGTPDRDGCSANSNLPLYPIIFAVIITIIIIKD